MSFPGMPIALGDIQSSLGRTERSRETLSEVDLVLQLFDAAQDPGGGERFVVDLLRDCWRIQWLGLA